MNRSGRASIHDLHIPDSIAPDKPLIAPKSLKLGDLVLVHHKPTGHQKLGRKLSGGIERYQLKRLKASPADAKWTHVGVYIGNYMLLEMLGHGAAQRGLWVYQDDNTEVRIRRKNGMTDTDGAKLVRAALDIASQRGDYGYLKLLYIRLGDPRRIVFPALLDPGTAICTELYVRAAQRALAWTPVKDTLPPLVAPSDLAASPEMSDVPPEFVGADEVRRLLGP